MGHKSLNCDNYATNSTWPVLSDPVFIYITAVNYMILL